MKIKNKNKWYVIGEFLAVSHSYKNPRIQKKKKKKKKRGHAIGGNKNKKLKLRMYKLIGYLLSRNAASDVWYIARTCVACSAVIFGPLHLANMGFQQMLVTELYI